MTPAIRLAVVVLPLVVLTGAGQAPTPPAAAAASAGQSAGRPAADVLEVPPPPFSDGIYPCTFCHDNKELKADPTRRTLEDHSDIALKHGPAERWCLDCHDLKNRDELHLASGELVSFDESYRLCGQCHGEKYRDWRVGVHGRRTGFWNGQKKYLLCVNCHDPHQPQFKPMAPRPAPLPPTRPR